MKLIILIALTLIIIYIYYNNSNNIIKLRVLLRGKLQKSLFNNLIIIIDYILLKNTYIYKRIIDYIKGFSRVYKQKYKAILVV